MSHMHLLESNDSIGNTFMT
jgi:hypothetical protein